MKDMKEVKDVGEKKEERQYLILPEFSEDQFDQFDEKRRDNYMISAVNHLKLIAYLTTSVIIAVLIVLCLNQYINNVPVWVCFLILWLGHAIIMILSSSSMIYTYKSLQSENPLDNLLSANQVVNKMFYFNGKKIKLAQYLLISLFSLLWISFILFTFELLLLLAIYSVVEDYVVLLPFYIYSVTAILSATVCR
jgi:F0F1-type ATP synthase assembly protein I